MTTTAAPAQAPAANEHQEPYVLLVAHDPAFDAAFSYVLKDAGFAVWSVATAREALSLVSYLPPEIVVFDLDGEESHGFGFLHELAAAALDAKVVVSSRDPSLAQLEANTRRQLGIDAVLSRPCRLDAIVETLRALAPAPRSTVSTPVAHIPLKGTVARLSLARVTARANGGV